MDNRTQTYKEDEKCDKRYSVGLGRGLDCLLSGREKRTSFGLGKGLDALIKEDHPKITSEEHTDQE